MAEGFANLIIFAGVAFLAFLVHSKPKVGVAGKKDDKDGNIVADPRSDELLTWPIAPLGWITAFVLGSCYSRIRKLFNPIRGKNKKR